MTDVTLCTFSRTSSQYLLSLCEQRATIANISLEMEFEGYINASSTTQKLHGARDSLHLC